MLFLKEAIEIIKSMSDADVSKVDYTGKTRSFKSSLQSNGPKFCDNIILWSIGKDRRDKIYKRCKEQFGKGFQLKLLRQSKLEGYDIAPINTPYFSFKVSLSDVPIDEVIHSLPHLISSRIILHDIDIAQDIQYITTRKDVKQFILDNNLVREKDIIDDRKKVGDNCISFYNEDRSLKIKYTINLYKC